MFTTTTTFRTISALFPTFATHSQSKTIKVSRLKIDEALGGYRIYQVSKEKQFLYISVAIGLGTALSLYILYRDATLINLVASGIAVGAFMYHQRRLRNTVREIFVDRLGQTLKIRKYGMFGTNLWSESVQIPIFVFKGVERKNISRGVTISGGGVYDYPKFAFHFHTQGVLDKKVFDHVIGGISVTYADIL